MQRESEVATDEAPGPLAARSWWRALAAARRRTRHHRQGQWFPLVLFGVIVCGAAPLYGRHFRNRFARLGRAFPAGVSSGHPFGAAVYWIVAGTLGYLLSAGFYWSRARRRGVRASPLAYGATGAVLVCLLVFSSLADVSLPLIVEVNPILPTLVIGLGLFVLASVGRSPILVVFAAGFFVLATADAAGFASPLVGHPTRVSFEQADLVVLGVLLVLAGIGFGLASRVGQRRAL